MKVSKRISLICMSFMLAFSFLVSFFPSMPKKSTNKASAASTTVSEIQLIDKNVFEYVTLSIAGKTLETDNIKSVDTNNDGKADTSYIITKDTTTISFKPLKYNYILAFESSLFYNNTFESDVIEKDQASSTFPSKFTVNDTEYNYQISGDGKISIYENNSRVNIGQSDLIKLVDIDENSKKFVFTKSYTLKSEATDTSFTFSVSSSNNTNATTYKLNFVRPILDFETDDVTLFTCTGLDIGDEPFTNEKIQRELSYENVKLEFTNNNYTKTNPLYFNINHNGFIYTFKLYSENEYLFVEYYDEQRQGSNNAQKNHDQSLATILNENGSVKTPVYKILNGDFNKFSINFDTTGRYEIEVYDSTYLLLKNQRQIIENEIINEKGEKEKETIIIEPEENGINYNYYSTSFYIKTKETAGNSSSAYDNAYVIMQSYEDVEDENTKTTTRNLLDYIVSESTQNDSVQVTIKNLNYYFENDEFIKNFTPTETLKDLNIVEFTKATLPGSANLPVTTYYTLSDLKEMFSKQTSKDKTLTINCTDDAVYEIVINRYTYNETTHKIEKIYDDNHKYQFTIVKQPRTYYTVANVDEYNDPTEINGEKNTLYYADTPYVTKPQSYKININKDMTFKSKFDSTPNDEYNSTVLSKTYLNEYTINYAMQAVKIEQVEFGDNSENKGKLGINFLGVGDITVNITVNSVTTTYVVKSGETLAFEAYGIYTVSIEDSMGTVGTSIIDYSKPTSISAVILIVLVGIIALAVVLFILASRGKVKTR